MGNSPPMHPANSHDAGSGCRWPGIRCRVYDMVGLLFKFFLSLAIYFRAWWYLQQDSPSTTLFTRDMDE